MSNDHYLDGQLRPTAEQIAWVLAHLHDHVGSGWSFRKLIYGRFGLVPAAYSVIYAAGSMDIHNILTGWEEPTERSREHGMEAQQKPA